MELRALLLFSPHERQLLKHLSVSTIRIMRMVLCSETVDKWVMIKFMHIRKGI